MEATTLEMLGHPADIVVFVEHSQLLALNIHEPTGMSTVHQLGVATMTMRVFVRNILDTQGLALLEQRLSDFLIDLPDVAAQPRTLSVITVLIDDRDNWHILAL